MFVGRNAELKFLEHYYRQDGNHILVVYGQRGVGKTALLKHFVENKEGFSYVARACSDREQRYQWACELKDAGIEISEYPEYHELFLRTVEQSRTRKMVILIEEFHHFLKGDASFVDKITSFLKNLDNGAQVMFVLCTSAAGWVENSMVKRIGSAALSINGLLKVREMKFAEIRRMFPGYSNASYIENYAVLGGIPGLWKNFSPQFETKENLIYNLLSRESRLYSELSVFMSDQLREPAVYNTILAAMARGCNKLNDIYKHTGFSRAKISVYLKNLMELELVEKVFSYDTEGKANTQKGVYRISNHLVHFYFTYLYPNLSDLERMGAEEFFRAYIAPSFNLYVADYFSLFCKQHFERWNKQGKLPFKVERVGEWVGKFGTIDIVAQNEEGKTILGICSWEKPVMRYDDYEWFLFCAEKAKLNPDYIYLFSVHNFEERLKLEAKVKSNMKLISMDEM